MKAKQNQATTSSNTKGRRIATLLQVGAGLGTALAIVALAGPKLPPVSGD